MPYTITEPTEKTINISCNYCNRKDKYTASDAIECFDKARICGWYIDEGHRCYCPNCVSTAITRWRYFKENKVSKADLDQ